MPRFAGTIASGLLCTHFIRAVVRSNDGKGDIDEERRERMWCKAASGEVAATARRVLPG